MARPTEAEPKPMTLFELADLLESFAEDFDRRSKGREPDSGEAAYCDGRSYAYRDSASRLRELMAVNVTCPTCGK